MLICVNEWLRVWMHLNVYVDDLIYELKYKDYYVYFE